MFRCKMLDGSGYVELTRITEDTDRHGNVRLYVRMPGRVKVRLRAAPGSPEFMTEYKAAVAGQAAPVGPVTYQQLTKIAPGTIRWLVQRYYDCAEFKQLNARTRHVRQLILRRVCEADGDKPYALLEPKHIRSRRDKKTDTPEAANSMIKALRQVFAFAMANDLVKSNPALAVPFLKKKGDGHHSWTDGEVAKFEARHPIGTPARLALALLLLTAQRRSDIVLFGPGHVQDGWLIFTQVKNAERKPISLHIPIKPELQAVIDATPTGAKTFLVNTYGKPFTANGFGNWFRERCDEAGLPQCSSHGLRKAAASRLAESGATDREIMAITGHTTSKEVTRYTKAANQKLLAEAAFGRVAPGGHDVIIVPPVLSGAKGGTPSVSNPLKTSQKKGGMVPRAGIEPATLRFSVACSTN